MTPTPDDPIDAVLTSYPALRTRLWEPCHFTLVLAALRDSDPSNGYAGPPPPAGPARAPAGTELKILCMIRRAGYCGECPRCRASALQERLHALDPARHPPARWRPCLAPVQLFHPQDAPADPGRFGRVPDRGQNGMDRGLGKQRAARRQA